jgi:hypothetical protein
VSYSSSRANYCCMRTQPRAKSGPNFFDVSEHKLSAYLQGFG